MAATKDAWKVFELKVAKFFGGQRNPLSGGNGKHTRGDLIHKYLYGECKYSQETPLWKSYRLLQRRSSSKGKIPYFFIADPCPIWRSVKPLMMIEPKNLLEMNRIISDHDVFTKKTAGDMLFHEGMAITKLYDDTKDKALKEGKVPYVALQKKSAPGWLIIFEPIFITNLAKEHQASLKEGKNDVSQHEEG